MKQGYSKMDIDTPNRNTGGHPSPNGLCQALRSNLDNWNISHTMLSDAIWSYLFACSALRDTYYRLSHAAPSEELENVLTEINQKLDTLACEEQSLRDMRISLTLLRNQSKTLAPINKLPPEILGHIFALSKTYCVSEKSDESLYWDPSSVCTYWRQVALDKTDLWTHIDIGFDTPAELSRLLLGRTKNVPIHVHVYEPEGEEYDDFPEEAADGIIALLTPHMHRVRSLEIKLESDTHDFIQSILDAWLNQGNESMARNLSVMRPEYSRSFHYIPESDSVVPENIERTLRALNTLHLGDVEFGWHSSAYHDLVDLRLEFRIDNDNTISLPRLYSILIANPILVTLKLAWLDITCPEEWVQPPRIVLSCLKILNLKNMWHRDTRVLLPLIALPGSSGELSVGLSIDEETISVAADFLIHSRVTTLYLAVDECDYGLLFQLSSSKSLFLPPTLILGEYDLDEALVSEGNPPFTQGSSPWYIPSVVLYDCIVSQQALEQIIVRHNVQNLRLDSCSASRPGQPIDGIRTRLLELHPGLQCCPSDASATKRRFRSIILGVFD